MKFSEYNRILTFVSVLMIIVGSSVTGVSQKSFHRIYPFIEPSTISTSGDAMQLKNGLYASVEFLLTPDPSDPQSFVCDTLVYNEFRPKGDVVRTQRIYINPNEYGGVNPSAPPVLTQGADETVYISFTTLGSTNGNSHVIKVSGQRFPLETYNIENVNGDFQSINVSSYKTSLVTSLTSLHNNENSIVMTKRALSGFSSNGDITRKYRTTGSNGNNTSVQLQGMAVNDKLNRIAMVGTADSVETFPYLLVTDSLGTVLFSRKYQDVTNLFSVLSPDNVMITQDTGFVVTGFRLGFGNNILGLVINGFVMKLDKVGNVQWSKQVSSGDDDVFDIIKAATLDANNDIVFGCGNINITTGDQEHYAVKYSQAGNEKTKKRYPRLSSNFEPTAGAIFKSTFGGTMWFNTALSELGQPVLSLIKLDDDLKTTCEDDLLDERFFDVQYLSDTVIWKIDNEVVNIDRDSLLLTDNVYDVPYLSLEVRPFCPKEPINWLFTATLEGATNYKWSTGLEGPIKDTLRVFEEGKYSVTVTIDKDVCFMLCDTSEITRYKLPGAFADNASLGSFCSDGTITIAAGYTPGHPEIKAIQWSNGDSGKLLTKVSTAGSYTVTITDGCDEIATATVGTGLFPQKLTNVTVTPSVEFDCLSGNYSGRILAMGNSTVVGQLGLGEEKFQWSQSGAATNFLNIDQDVPVSVAVTVTDGCGNTAVGRFESSATGKNSLNPSIFIDKSQICQTSTIRLNALNNPNGRIAYKWSNGEVTPFINVNTAGVYSVTLTDLCNHTASAEITVTEGDLLPDDIRYPKVFFPDDGVVDYNMIKDTSNLAEKKLAQELNRTFGPILTAKNCPDQITNYEFRVFNRWGQEVFESLTLNDEWDGKKDGDTKHLSDTFVWVVKYTVIGKEKVLKGDINMIR